MKLYYFLLYMAVLLAAVGQVMLKLGVGRGGFNLGLFRLNRWVFLGLLAMVGSMLLSVRGLSVVPLRDMAFILPTVYVAVPLLSRVFLKERVGGRTVVGTVILVLGIVLFNIPSLSLF